MIASVSIVVVNWNTGEMLFDCCQSIVVADLSSIDLRNVIVVDNASTDKSISNLDYSSLPLILIKNEQNQGFGVACNQGAVVSTGEFILFLNPDTRLYANSLSKSLAFMSDLKNTDVGICGIRLEGANGEFATSFAYFPDALSIIKKTFGLGSRKPAVFPADAELSVQGVNVDQVIGAYFLMRADLFRQLGGFDERFFVYFEEVDLSLRAKQAGWRSVCLPSVAAFHFGGGASNQVKARRLFYSLRSRLLYAFKHFSWFGAVGVLLATLLIEPLSRSVWVLLRGSWAGFKETWVAYALLWQWLPQWLFKGVTR